MKFVLPATSLAILMIAPYLCAGTGSGGSGPPAKEALQEMLFTQDLMSAGLFAREPGDMALGINGALNAQVAVRKDTVSTQSIRVSDNDFEKLSTVKTIDAIQLNAPVDQAPKSYWIESGNRLGEIILKDRRQLMRDSVK